MYKVRQIRTVCSTAGHSPPLTDRTTSWIFCGDKIKKVCKLGTCMENNGAANYQNMVKSDTKEKSQIYLGFLFLYNRENKFTS